MTYVPATREQAGRRSLSREPGEYPLKQTVFVVDDDPLVRDSVATLLESVGYSCQLFSSADEFLESLSPEHSGCLISDIQMPGLNGLELQSRLVELDSKLPIIFITGHGDVPMAVEAIQRGAVSFFQKPFREQELLDCIRVALERNRQYWADTKYAREVKERVQSLTKRESEVFDLIVAGMANKRAAHELGVSQRTVEIHRARVMQKMRAQSLAELVRMHMLCFDN